MTHRRNYLENPWGTGPVWACHPILASIQSADGSQICVSACGFGSVFEWQLESGIEFDYVHVEFCAGTCKCVKSTVPVVMLPYLVKFFCFLRGKKVSTSWSLLRSSEGAEEECISAWLHVRCTRPLRCAEMLKNGRHSCSGDLEPVLSLANIFVASCTVCTFESFSAFHCIWNLFCMAAFLTVFPVKL